MTHALHLRRYRRLGTLFLAFVPVITLAQQSEPAQQNQLEEINVTARKVEENIMSVPLAITALSADALEVRNLINPEQLSQFTPGFYQQDSNSASSGRTDRSFQTLVFRGLNVANNSGLTSGGSLFIDGAPVTALTAAGFADLERVEVLTGPQSVYFGRSTFAGAINYVTRDPDMEKFGGRVAAQFSSYNSTNDTLSLEGPIIPDKLAVRFTAYHDIQGGNWTNSANPQERLGEQGTDSFSLSIVAKPIEGLKIKGYFNYYEDKDGPPAQAAFNPDQATCHPNGGNYFCGKIPRLGTQFISAYDVVSPIIQSQIFENVNKLPILFDPAENDAFGLHRWAYQGDVIASYDWDSGYNFTSISAYHGQRWQAVDDLDWRDAENLPNPYYGTVPGVLPFINVTSLIQTRGHDWSQEFRFTSPQSNPLRWTVGANYLDAETNTVGLVTLDFGRIGLGAGNPQIVHTTGIFGGVYYDFLPKWTLSFESRYQFDTVISVSDMLFDQNTFRSFTPRVTLDYKLQENSSLYALWSRGDRPGGFNVFPTATPVQLAYIQRVSGATGTYAQEQLDNYEVGFKNHFLNNTASVRVAAYYGILKNEQESTNVQVFAPNGQISNGYNATISIGKTDIFGVEFQADWLATNHLSFSSTFDWSGSDIKQYVCADCLTYSSGSANVTGKKFDNVPEFSGTLSAQYTDHLMGDYDWYGRVDDIYTGKVFADLDNTAYIGASDRVNLRVGFKDKAVKLEGFVTNLTNNLTYTGTSYGSDNITFANTQLRVGLPQKRAFGVRADYSF